MSFVDTGLGWGCDSAYLVNQPGEIARLYNSVSVVNSWRIFEKVNSGNAICAVFTNAKDDGNTWYIPCLLSTDVNATVMHAYDSHDDSGNVSGSPIVIDGKTWYLCRPFPMNSTIVADAQYNCETNNEEIDLDGPSYSSGYEILTRKLLSLAGVVIGSTQIVPVQFQNLQDTFDITVYPPLDIGELTRPLAVNLNYCRDKYSNANWYWDMTASDGDILFLHFWYPNAERTVYASKTSATYIQRLQENGSVSNQVTVQLTDTYTYAGKTVYYRFELGGWNPAPDDAIPEIMYTSSDLTTEQLKNVAWTMIYDND